MKKAHSHILLKTFLSLLFYLYCHAQLQAQFINNGSFETGTPPTAQSQIANANGWGSMSDATPDYFRTNGAAIVQIPNNFAGSQGTHPLNQNGYGGIYFTLENVGTNNSGPTRYQEYLKYQLDQTLQPGKSYTITYYVSAGDNNSTFLNKLQVLFSENDVSQTSTNNTFRFPFTNLTPQITNTAPGGGFFNDVTNWVKLTGTVTVPSTSNGYNWVYFGNFDANIVCSGTAIDHIYYYYDDVSIVCGADAGPDVELCKGFRYDLPFPVSNDINWRYKVISGDMNSLIGGNRVQPDKTSMYVLTTVDDSCCRAYDTVTVTVTQCCKCDSCRDTGDNLITNGDFEDGATGFFTVYTQQTGPATTPGHYNVEKIVDGYNNNTWHESGNPGKFLWVDGDQNTAGLVAWEQTITVTPERTYVLCMKVNNLILDTINYADPKIQIKINGVPLGPATTVTELPDQWLQMKFTWKAPPMITSAKIDIVDNDITHIGNDFGVDNIFFAVCTPVDSADAGPDTTICYGKSYTLPIPDAPTQWVYNRISPGLPVSIIGHVVTPTTTTVYVLDAFGADGCHTFDTVVVHVKCCDCDTMLNPGPMNLIINGDFSGGNTGFTSYYSYGISGPGTYTVATSSAPYNANWDKVGNPGMFLISDGSTTYNTPVWRETVAVTANTSYSVCGEGANLRIAPGLPTLNDPIMDIRINGTSLGTVTLNEPNGWTIYHNNWNSGSATTAVIEVYNNNTQMQGNDMGIDNLSLAPCQEPPLPPGAKQSLNSDKPKADGAAGNQLTVFPNPATNTLTILSEQSFTKGTSIEVIDYAGRTVMNILANTGNKSQVLNTSQLAQGTYLIVVHTGDRQTGKKLFIKK